MPSKKQRAKEKKQNDSPKLQKAFGKSNNQELFVNVATLFPKFSKWVIKTSSNEIEESIEMFSKELKKSPIECIDNLCIDGKQYIGVYDPKKKLQSQYERALGMVNQYTEEQVTQFKSNNPVEFGNWCDDIVISYSMRVILFELPIPIMSKPPQSICQALFGK